MGLLPTRIKAVFFDAVGTVLIPDPDALEVYRALAHRSGVVIPAVEIRSRFIEAYRHEEVADRAAGWVTSEDREIARWRRIVFSALHGVPDPETCFHILYQHFSSSSAWQLAPGTDDVVAGLVSRELIVGLGSNYDRRLLTVLDGFPELLPLRPRTVISSVVGVRKPAAAFFQAITAAAGCEAHEILFVGDDVENDYLGAKAAGLASVLLDPNGRSDVTNRIQRLRELLRLV